MTQLIINDIIKSPDLYVKEILSGLFIDIKDGDNAFKGIQVRENDELQKKIEDIFPDYTVTYNFVRQSPLNQSEPNFIHSDEMMGDKTVLLYLNKTYPKGAGTTLYHNNLPVCVFYAAYNRMVIFDSIISHSRNIFENYGIGNDSRLVQVMFLKLKL